MSRTPPPEPGTPPGDEQSERPGRRWWRLTTPAVFVAGGVLLATSAVNAAGTDLRPGRYDDLADLARQQSTRVQALRDRVAELDAEVERLSEDVDSGVLAELQAEVDAVAGAAGLTAVAGPGLTVTLDDAPEEVLSSAGQDASQAIVHQQDIQAVVNALWAGGAEAMTIQGQRVVSTTGIRCVGNTVVLHGVPYSPPYVVSAIGDPDRLRSAVDASPYISAYLEAVETWQLGWDVEVEGRVVAPEFTGPTDRGRARVPEA